MSSASSQAATPLNSADVIGEWTENSTPVRPEATRYVTFKSDGTWLGSLDGCNGQGGRWILKNEPDLIEFSDLGTTFKACVDPKTTRSVRMATSASLTFGRLTLLDGRYRLGELHRTAD